MVQPYRKAEEHFTYRDLQGWPQDERWELINGVAYAVSSPDIMHQRISRELMRQISTALLGRRCEAFAAPLDVLLPQHDESNDEIDTVVQPDIFIVCDPSKTQGRTVRGAPDLVAEILSVSTRHYDTARKLLLYQQVGVREYWIIDPDERRVQVFLLQANGRFALPIDYQGDVNVSVTVLDGLVIDLGRVFPGEAQ